MADFTESENPNIPSIGEEETVKDGFFLKLKKFFHIEVLTKRKVLIPEHDGW